MVLTQIRIIITPLLSLWCCGPQIWFSWVGGWQGNHAPNRLFVKEVRLSSSLTFHFPSFSSGLFCLRSSRPNYTIPQQSVILLLFFTLLSLSENIYIYIIHTHYKEIEILCMHACMRARARVCVCVCVCYRLDSRAKKRMKRRSSQARLLNL